MKKLFINENRSTEDNIKLIEELLHTHMPNDYDNIKKSYPFDMEIKMRYKGSITPDELLKKKLDNLDSMKSIAERELEELRNR